MQSGWLHWWTVADTLMLIGLLVMAAGPLSLWLDYHAAWWVFLIVAGAAVFFAGAVMDTRRVANQGRGSVSE